MYQIDTNKMNLGEDLPRHLLNDLLALLRAQSWNYQTCHWQVQGEPFYGDHLLFERLYNNLGEEVDVLAEKIMGILGEPEKGPPFSNESQMDKTKSWIQSWSVYVCPFQRSMESEKALQRALKSIYDILKKTGDLTLGLDDFLMSLASAHEAHMYLLKQRMVGMEHKRQASVRAFRERFSKGVERRDQDPDYRDYVKRKRDKGEKALNRGEWEDWMEGKDRPGLGPREEKGKGKNKEKEDEPKEPSEKPRPKKEVSDPSAEESPEAIREQLQKEDKPGGPLSDNDRKLLDEHLSKTPELKRVKKLVEKIKDSDVAQTVIKAVTMSEADAQKRVDQMKKEMAGKFKEEMKEEAAKLDLVVDDKAKIKDLIKDNKKQFAEAMVRGMPDELKKEKAPSFLAFALGHILDSIMDELGAKVEGLESSMDKQKRFEEYEKKFDKAQGKLKRQKTDLEGALKESEEADRALKDAEKALKDAEGRLQADDPKLEGLQSKLQDAEKKAEEAAKKTQQLARSVEDTTGEISKLNKEQKRGPLKGPEKEKLDEAQRKVDEAKQQKRKDEDKVDQAIKEEESDKRKDEERSRKTEEKTKSKKEQAEADKRKEELKERRKPKVRKKLNLEGMDTEQLDKEVQKLKDEIQKYIEEHNKLTESLEGADEDKEEEIKADIDRLDAQQKAAEKDLDRAQKAAVKQKKENAKKAGLRFLFAVDEPSEEDTDEGEASGDEAYDEFFEDLVTRFVKPDPSVLEKALQSMLDEKGDKKATRLGALWFASRKTPKNNPQTAEGYFFDNPEKREVQQFHRSRAITNLTPEGRAKGAPPTMVDIHRSPGGEGLSTLKRYVVESDDPDVEGVPKGREELPKHPRLSGWTFAPRRNP